MFKVNLVNAEAHAPEAEGTKPDGQSPSGAEGEQKSKGKEAAKEVDKGNGKRKRGNKNKKEEEPLADEKGTEQVGCSGDCQRAFVPMVLSAASLRRKPLSVCCSILTISSAGNCLSDSHVVLGPQHVRMGCWAMALLLHFMHFVHAGALRHG